MAKRNNYKRDQHIGGWRLSARLGKGGNGEVWRATNGTEEHAIKLLKNIRPSIYTRFKSEIKVMMDCSDVPGVMPILGHSLPDDFVKSAPWFLMPEAVRFSEWRKNKSVVDVVTSMIDLAKTLDVLHKRNIYHRDIKPANILFYDERLHLTDFGLVMYPNKEDITEKGKDIGPKFTMAPEMRRNADESNLELADVYSFAKTLWISITGELKCFDGQYNPYSTLNINAFCTGLYTKSLSELLSNCTDHDPKKRPQMAEVVSELSDWLSLNNSFHDKNLTQWFDLQNKLFPTGAPSSVSWSDLDDIVTVLNEISCIPSLNHMFYPDGGGNTFIGVKKAAEPGLIAIEISEKSRELIKPKKLTFESFGLSPRWNYFRIECETLTSTGIYNNLPATFSSEELVEVTPGQYIDRQHWDLGHYNGSDLPESAKVVSRFFKGAFVIFSTSSTYNQTSSTYDGRHNKITETQFRSHIEQAAIRYP